ncbi:MAG TPA: RHS repeat-associated core domain-containing protein [Terracidiphilus sp.]|nr:RHS repeat-associated core domain-containing protein [Terracidiphilus sp.]
MTSVAGNLTDSYEYDAFGNSWTVSGTTPNEMMYRGEQYDTDLGLYYLRARYYNPLTGRFLSRDPETGKLKVPASLHKYLYADGDPINGVDPSGRLDLIQFAKDLVRVVITAPPAAGLVVEFVACGLAIADAQITADKGGSLSGPGTAGLFLSCGLAELHYILYWTVP